MPEIKFDTCWKVEMTEYDEGVQRPMGTKYFDNEEEAKRFCQDYACGNSSCFYRASYQRV